MSLVTNFFYYTPVNTKINYQQFKDYCDKINNDNIKEELADLMDNLEKTIVASEAFKHQENKPMVNQTKWQSYKIKKLPLNSLFMILNKLTNDNFQDIIVESLEYKNLSSNDLNQLADVFLGKCIKETKNVKLFIDYLKALVDNKLWYIKVGDEILSFKDIMLNRLEHEYTKLTKIAGHIEDVFKNRICDENTDNNLEGSHDYLKKKNIILSLIELIAIFFNNHLISYGLLTDIFDKLKTQYGELTTNKIYMELWLTLWNGVSHNIHKYFSDDYTNYHNWLEQQKNILIETITYSSDKTKNNIADVSRLINLIDHSLSKNYNIINVHTEISNNESDESNDSDELNDEIKTLKTESDFIRFKNKHNGSEELKNYVIKHLFDNINNTSTLSFTLPNVKKHLMSSYEFKDLIDELLGDEDLLCDYPNFETNIMNYI